MLESGVMVRVTTDWLNTYLDLIPSSVEMHTGIKLIVFGAC